MEIRKVAAGALGGLVGVAALVTVPAWGTEVEQVGPVFNGEFELYAPGQDATCEAAGDANVQVLPQDQNPHLPDPTDEGSELPWLWLASVSPCQTGAFKAAHWSSSSVSQWSDWDADGDREVKIDRTQFVADDPVGRSHNFWQAYPSPQQAWSADFERLEFRVEEGTIPSSAAVILSLTQSPYRSRYAGIFLECQLAFRASQLVPDGDGLVSVDPVDGQFTSRAGSDELSSGCAGMAKVWADGDAAARRHILGQLRIVQHSYWNFDSATPIVLDGIRLVGAKTTVEGYAA